MEYFLPKLVPQNKEIYKTTDNTPGVMYVALIYVELEV